jgi:hypothetical protein
MAALALPLPCRVAAFALLGSRSANGSKPCGRRIPRQYRKSFACLPSRCAIVNLLSDKSARSIGGAGEFKPSFRMIISLTEKIAAYRLAIARDIMAFQRNLETFLAKRLLGRQARDLAVFLGA